MSTPGDIKKTQALPIPGDATCNESTRLITIAGPLQGTVFALPFGETVIGRLEEHPIYLPSPGVSKTHCSITCEDDGIFIQDKDSTNGTYVNNRQLSSGVRQQLSNSDTITVFDTTFILLAPPSGDEQEDIQIDFQSAAREAHGALVDGQDVVELRQLRQKRN